VSDLIYKKGYGKIDNKRVPLIDNNIIEQVMNLVTAVFGFVVPMTFPLIFFFFILAGIREAWHCMSRRYCT